MTPAEWESPGATHRLLTPPLLQMSLIFRIRSILEPKLQVFMFSIKSLLAQASIPPHHLEVSSQDSCLLVLALSTLSNAQSTPCPGPLLSLGAASLFWGGGARVASSRPALSVSYTRCLRLPAPSPAKATLLACVCPHTLRPRLHSSAASAGTLSGKGVCPFLALPGPLVLCSPRPLPFPCSLPLYGSWPLFI